MVGINGRKTRNGLSLSRDPSGATCAHLPCVIPFAPTARVGGSILYDVLRQNRAAATVDADRNTLPATIGRWMQEESIGFDAGDGDLYRYCGNDPTNGTDLSGLQDSTKEADHESEFEKRTGVRKAITDNTLTPVAGVQGESFVAKDCLGIAGCNVAFKFDYAYSGAFVFNGTKFAGLYTKISASFTGKSPNAKFTVLSFLQVVSQYHLKDGKQVIEEPDQEYKKIRAGYGKDEEKAKSLGWFVDAPQDAVPWVHNESISGGFVSLDKQNRTVAWDCPASSLMKNTGKTLYTCLMGFGDSGWEFIACVKWGFYADENGKVTMSPEKPEPSSDIPPEVKDAVDRWNGLPNVKQLELK